MNSVKFIMLIYLFTGCDVVYASTSAKVSVGPVAAESKYGKLDQDYRMLREHKFIVNFSLEPFFNELPVKSRPNNLETRVNKDIVLPLIKVMAELQETGLIREIVSFHGCYASRAIREIDRPSTHAFGLACDFNAYQGVRFSKPFIEILEKYGWVWGGSWCKRKDKMHFSYAWERRGKCALF